MSEAGHYPYQVGIDAYGNGGFRFAEMSHRGSLLCLPTGMHAWGVVGPGELDLETLATVLALGETIDVLVLGMGEDIAAVPAAVRDALRERAIGIEIQSTGSAVRTYNVLMDEGRAVAAALIAVDRAR